MENEGVSTEKVDSILKARTKVHLTLDTTDQVKFLNGKFVAKLENEFYKFYDDVRGEVLVHLLDILKISEFRKKPDKVEKEFRPQSYRGASYL